MRDFDQWWPRIRDVAAFLVGVYLLLLKKDVDVTQEMIGAACLGVSASGIAKALFERNGRKNGNGNGS